MRKIISLSRVTIGIKNACKMHFCIQNLLYPARSWCGTVGTFSGVIGESSEESFTKLVGGTEENQGWTYTPGLTTRTTITKAFRG